ncbi:MAG: 3',5'-cyclic-nucleotide phosphodiesterase [Thermodesulfobacteriota bacterium]
MEIRVLGCYGSEMPGFRPSSFLINKSLLLDAGAITSVLSLEEQLQITHILITHSHLDHIKDILFLADNIIEQNHHPICIASLPAIIEQIKVHMLNNSIWPDFTVIPERGPVLNYLHMDEEKDIQINDITCKAVKVDHTVEAVGYIVRDCNGAIIYTGDTGATQRIWDLARTLKDLRAVIVEVSFPDDLRELAVLSAHLTPALLHKELYKMNRPDVPVYVFHMKPMHLVCIQEELKYLSPFLVKPLTQGDLIII